VDYRLLLLADLLTRGTHCLKMFAVNLELHLSVLLLNLIFQSFCQVNASVGRYQSHLWPTSPLNVLTLFFLFLFYIVLISLFAAGYL